MVKEIRAPAEITHMSGWRPARTIAAASTLIVLVVVPCGVAQADVLGVHTPPVLGLPGTPNLPNLPPPADRVVDDAIKDVNGITDSVVPPVTVPPVTVPPVTEPPVTGPPSSPPPNDGAQPGTGHGANGGGSSKQQPRSNAGRARGTATAGGRAPRADRNRPVSSSTRSRRSP
jgi:hypothetical protein